MHYPYIALIEKAAGDPEELQRITADLQEAGFEARGRVGCVTVFAAKQTPTLTLPDGSLLIGELYDRAGARVAAPIERAACPAPSWFRQHLLDEYWGEYLLIQPPGQGQLCTTIMRDPSAGVACVYTLQGSLGFITSDLAIAARIGLHAERIDWDFVRHSLIYPHLKVARTALAGISELLPGCTLTTDGKKASVELTWSPWRFVSTVERLHDRDVAAETVRDALTLVVKATARTDSALLLELSGGLDSSIVGACLQHADASVACCTAVTPLPGADERHYAGQVAAQLGVGLRRQALDFNEADISFDLPAHSPRPAVWVLGHAVARAMNEAADREGVRSYFSGSGGDTVFGYLKTAAPGADAVRELGLPGGARAIVDLSKLHGCTVAKAARLTARKLYARPKPPRKPEYSLLTFANEGFDHDPHPWHLAPRNALAGDRERIFDLAGNQMFMDATVRAKGRRVRMPLLSQPVMEACLRVPSWMWIAEGRNRSIARRAFSQSLPADVLNRRSKGSFLNYTFGIYGRNKAAIRAFLLDGHLRAHGLIDAKAVDDFLGRHFQARDRSFMRVFDLCMIENWIRNHT
jgi:asparagine synthase (glutamine-hydrolysing)